MKILIYILVSGLLLIPGPEWPSKKFIKKFNYKEVMGSAVIDPIVLDTIKEGQLDTLDRWPMYPDGETGFINHIIKTTKYPEEARDQGISGTVYLTFVVGEKGFVEDIEIVKGVHPALDNEAIRVMNCMRRWIPGVHKDVFVRVQYNLPFKFTIK